MIWHDEKNILDNAAVNALSAKVPISAKCCDAPEIHLHAHRGWGRNQDRCSAWIWCSHCGLFSHLDGIAIHHDWENNLNVDFSRVCAVPEYLDTVKDTVDRHLKRFFAS